MKEGKNNKKKIVMQFAMAFILLGVVTAYMFGGIPKTTFLGTVQAAESGCSLIDAQLVADKMLVNPNPNVIYFVDMPDASKIITKGEITCKLQTKTKNEIKTFFTKTYNMPIVSKGNNIYVNTGNRIESEILSNIKYKNLLKEKNLVGKEAKAYDDTKSYSWFVGSGSQSVS